MALNIKNAEVERLAGEVSRLANESKTEAIRRALEERRARLRMRGMREEKKARLIRLLTQSIWPEVPANVLGRKISKKEVEKILGYGPDGV